MATSDNGIKKGMTESAKTPRGRRNREGFIVYEEFSITVPVGDMSFVKFTVGHERTSNGDSDAALTATEKAAWAWNQKIADRRVRLLKRMLRAIKAEEG